MAGCPNCGVPFAAPPPAQPQVDPYAQYYRGQAENKPDSNRLLVVILLWLFLGGFGVHRFYLGETATATLMLILTLMGIATSCILIGYIPLAVVGVWTLVDLVLILTGSLRPKDGTRLV